MKRNAATPARLAARTPLGSTSDTARAMASPPMAFAQVTTSSRGGSHGAEGCGGSPVEKLAKQARHGMERWARQRLHACMCGDMRPAENDAASLRARMVNVIFSVSGAHP